MTKLSDLGVRLQIYGNKIPPAANNLKKETAKDLHGRLVRVTPVDTGRAHRNWLIAHGGPNNDRLPESLFAGRGAFGDGSSASAGPTIARGQAIIALAKPEIPVHITNNTPYIGLLNSKETPSTKALPYFVQTAVLSSAAKLRDSVKKAFRYG